MRTFLKKTALIFCTSLLSITAAYGAMLMLSRNITGFAPEVFYILEKAEHNSGLPAVILGDSVCNQLWPQQEDSPQFSHLGCNQAITPAGTYLLLRKYLEHNPQTKDVFYIICPQSLGNDLNVNHTYQYFVIPFINNENIKLLDNETVLKLYSKFGEIFVLNKYIKTFLLNNNLFMKQYVNHVRVQAEQKYTHRLSPTAIIYLRKIRSLCSGNNIKLHILPLPMPDITENHNWKAFSEDVVNYGLDDILGNFVNNIRYYPDDWFSDGVHFKQDILKQHINEIKNVVMNY